MLYTGERCPECDKAHVVRCDPPGRNSSREVFLAVAVTMATLLFTWYRATRPSLDSSITDVVILSVVIFFEFFWIIVVGARHNACRRCMDCNNTWRP